MIAVKSAMHRACMRVTLIDRIHSRDFIESVTPAAQHLCDRHGSIRLLLLDVRRFHGWEGGGTFATQIRFLHAFGRRVERVAVLGPRAWHGVVPVIAALFVVAEVRSFAPGQGWLLRRWVRTGR